jgi:chaperonin GroES
MAKPNFRPLGDRVLVQPLEEGEVKRGGIIITDTAKEKPPEATIIAIGNGKRDEQGKKQPFEVKVGDKVLISKVWRHGNQDRRNRLSGAPRRRHPRHSRLRRVFPNSETL